MVRTKSQLENLSKKELIDGIISVEDISCKLSDLTSRFDDFGFGITPSMLNLMKEVNLRRFIMLLTLKNFLELTI